MPLKLNYQLMKPSDVNATLDRMADEILQANDSRPVVLIGIQRRGVPMARRIAIRMAEKTQREPQIGTLDINLYRDDLSTVGERPIVHSKQMDISVEGKDIVLMDDVLYTGRTIRAAMDALFDHGRPARVQLLVLIDRGHRELPIEARYVGRMVQTSGREIIEVKFQEIDGQEKVLLVERVEDQSSKA